MKHRLPRQIDAETAAGLILLGTALVGYGLQGLLVSLILSAVSGKNPLWTFVAVELILALASLFVIRLTGQRR